MFEPLKGGSLVFLYFISCYIILGVAGFIFDSVLFSVFSFIFILFQCFDRPLIGGKPKKSSV